MEAALRFRKAQICHSGGRSCRADSVADFPDCRPTMQLATAGCGPPTTGRKCGGDRQVSAISALRAADGTCYFDAGRSGLCGPSPGRPLHPASGLSSLRRGLRGRSGRAVGGFLTRTDSPERGIATPFTPSGCAYIRRCGGLVVPPLPLPCIRLPPVKCDRLAIAQRPVSRQDSDGTVMLYVQA